MREANYKQRKKNTVQYRRNICAECIYIKHEQNILCQQQKQKDSHNGITYLNEQWIRSCITSKQLPVMKIIVHS